MSWKDSLTRVTMFDGRKMIGGSFRGVPFFVPSSDRDGGRRQPVSDYPLRNDPGLEDLGRSARVFQVEAYLLGDDYVAQRNALISALEDVAGPGELVHPYFGVRRVGASVFKCRETVADGGMATFSITFTEWPDRPSAPVEQVDIASLMKTRAVAAKAGARAELARTFDPLGLPSFAIESATASITAATDAVFSALSPIATTTDDLAVLNYKATLLNNAARSAASTPDGVLAMFDGLVSVVETLADTLTEIPIGLIKGLFNAFDADSGPAVIPTTATRAREAANKAALDASLRRALIAEAARRARDVAFVSLEEALETRAGILRRLDEQIASAGNDAYPGLVDLRAALVLAIPGDATYARVINVERRVAVPSLLLSFQLYGSVDGEADLIARNHTQHPGFMAGTLQALSNA